ncbi:hypothetical protein CSAL01_02405 [Colletotrichum salicis]|uniref:Heterokaryon incompatibility domain-containing protein n=1 Tax=Colletotrichum salicis TaxID=1209931 RepID=A0A135UTF4_9PEZI|nr:hypothetical protein CSAL01_02405 [Colletotrichum salicis]
MLLVERVTKRSNYIALSHRWMEASKMPRCVSTNIKSLKKNIPWSALTRNFQDAIVFIKELASWYAKGHPDHETEYEMAGREHVIKQKSPRPPSRLDLMTRGWVMQERLLSRRFVVFAPNEVMWECYEGSQCECGRLSGMTGQLNLKEEKGVMSQYNHTSYRYYDSKRADDPNYSFLPMPLKMAYYASLDDKGEHAARNLRNWWRRLVERYTTLDLTQESDRLPAIMGLAIQYGRRTGQEMEGYLAGIWRKSLPLDLLWHKENPSTESTSEYSKNKGPTSWSWASCRGQVRMPREESLSKLTYFAQLTSVNVGMQIAVGMRCPVFAGLGARTRDETFPIAVLDYAPDRAASLTTSIWEDEATFALISRVGEGDETTWLYLHIKPVHDSEGGGIKYSRIGLFELGRRRHVRTEGAFSDELVESCFKSRRSQDIELI